MGNRDKQLTSKYHTEKHAPFHERLRYERQRRGWSQAYIAERLGSDTKSVGRWERGEVFPSPYHRYRLLELFESNAQEMGLIEDDAHDRSKGYSNKSLPGSSSSIPSPTIVEVAGQFEQLEGKTQSRTGEIGQVEYEADQDPQFERQKQWLEIEKQRLELLEKRLEIQKRGVEYALEAAKKVVDTLQPNADEAARTMLIQTLLPKFLQLFSGKGLELTFTVPEDGEAAIF